MMTLGEFRKWTEQLSNDIQLYMSYGGEITPIKAMDYLDENSMIVGGDIYEGNNVMGSVRVAAFCKKK